MFLSQKKLCPQQQEFQAHQEIAYTQRMDGSCTD